MGVGSLFWCLGWQRRRKVPEYRPDPEILEEIRKRQDFHTKYDDKMRSFFEEFPRVISYGANDPDACRVTFKGKKGGIPTEEGKLVLDENGDILSWISHDGKNTLKRTSEPSGEMLTAQLKGLLEDDPQASRYCEQVAATLLEDGSCIFNAPYGLKIKKTVFREKYYSKEWGEAWIAALLAKFQAKEVFADEAAGIGCFRLKAI